jgi:signal peptide peptidase SppA
MNNLNVAFQEYQQQGKPYVLEEYFGVWAVEPTRFRGLMDHVQSLDLREHLRQQIAIQRVEIHAGDSSAVPTAQAGPPEKRTPYQVAGNGVAVIPIVGSMMKMQSSLSSNASTVEVRRAIRAAAKDPSVSAIVLRIDSPGGTVSGTADLGADVAAANAVKPVLSYCEDCCCSAAYWVAAQSAEIWTNQTAHVGSIGVFMQVNDYSQAAANEGVKVHVLKFGEHKGTGVPGTPVTLEQLAELQTVIDALGQEFVAAVASGRRMTTEKASSLATGQVWIGSAAKSQGLVDQVGSFDAAVARAQVLAVGRSGKDGRTMSVETKPQADGLTTATPKAASAAELKASCPRAGSDWILSQLEAGATLDSARTAYTALLQERLEAAEKAAASKSATDTKGAAPTLGRKPITASHDPEEDDDDPGSDAVDRFHSEVNKRIANGASRSDAIRAVVRKHPDLHAAYVLATNA